MPADQSNFGLGVFEEKGDIFLVFNDPKNKFNNFLIDKSSDGLTFKPQDAVPQLIQETRKFILKKKVNLETKNLKDLRISKSGKEYILTYIEKGHMTDKSYTAVSKDMKLWKLKGQNVVKRSAGFESMTGPMAIVPNFKYKGRYVGYFGTENIEIAVSKDLVTWEAADKPVLEPRNEKFDCGPLIMGSIELTDKGIAVFYYIKNNCGNGNCFSVGSALFDHTRPTKLLYRSENALIEHVEGFLGKKVTPLGVVQRGNVLLSYWDVTEDGIVVISHPIKDGHTILEGKTLKLVLEKDTKNPILEPNPKNKWENKAVFNPAAIYENGKIHLIYRAVGDSDVSVLGLATTKDGINIDERLDEPIYVPRAHFEGVRLPKGASVDVSAKFNDMYASGGAYGGCEDPRITKVDDKYVMMYVAWDGGSHPRLAMSSINCQDFDNRNWNWSDPVLVSRPGLVDKSGCVLPKKINGKYVVFHRVYPNIIIDYVDSLDQFDGMTTFLKGDAYIGPRHNAWDSRKLGIGGPPIKTDKGWLLIYQGVDNRDASRYKIGAMILDADKPEKVLYRSKKPILEPEHWYENNGLKYGVVYPCGSVIHDDTLRVYYGGSDMVVCEAHAPIQQFLEDLTTREEAELTPQIIKSRW